ASARVSTVSAERHSIKGGEQPQEPAAAMALLLELMVEHKASDLHLQSENEPCFRIDGDIVPLDGWGRLGAYRLNDMLFSMTPPKNKTQYEELKDTDFAHETAAARYRVNLFSDRKGIGAVLRQIPNQIKTAAE